MLDFDVIVNIVKTTRYNRAVAGMMDTMEMVVTDGKQQQEGLHLAGSNWD
jgi:hypothetical protein